MIPYPTFTPIGRYVDFSPATWAIPSIYWDAFSPEQRYHELCKALSKLISYADQLGIETDYLGQLYEQLVADFEKFQEYGFDDYYKEQIEKWVAENMPDIIADAIRMVFFGLTEDGYFCAYIPKPWYDIVFDTGAVYGSDEYGRLILNY